jgi:hypothetical protein
LALDPNDGFDCSQVNSLLSLSAVSKVKRVLALLMLALWMPASSHELLEYVETIHQAHAPESGADHDAADGVVLFPSTLSAPPVHQVVLYSAPPAVNLAPQRVEIVTPLGYGPAPPLPNMWQFVHRAALLARAPSFIA